ncbi:hypothetical protein [Arcobacter sp.]|uniref:hypothetical protein n=1 Tax=Arcobacter sp. TaxID=1872629 RepID=UPI003D0BF40F
MINLPHQKPIKFVKNIIKQKDNKAIISCSFPFLPTLSMICEASAQATIAFSPTKEDIKIGFLISLKNIEQLQELTQNEYLIELEKSFTFGSMTEFSFKLLNDNQLFAQGELTIALEN